MKDPYQAGMFQESPYYEKSEVTGKFVVVLRGKLEERGLTLIKQPSRCILKNEIHELILTEEDASPGGVVNKIAYLGFFETEKGGVLTIGDSVYLADQLIGTVLGFDETHMPNHQNIILKGQRQTGEERGVTVGDAISFQHTK